MQQFINAIKNYSENLKDESDRQELTSEIMRICDEESIAYEPGCDLVDLLSLIIPLLTGGGNLIFKFSALAGKLLKQKNKVNDIFVDHGVPLKSNTSGFLAVTGLILGKDKGTEMISQTIEDMEPYASSYDKNTDHSSAIEQLVTNVLRVKFPDVFNTIETLKFLKQ